MPVCYKFGGFLVVENRAASHLSSCLSKLCELRRGVASCIQAASPWVMCRHVRHLDLTHWTSLRFRM